jgi:anti-sigma regulatory factor (Ser/Thr protein kinase)
MIQLGLDIPGPLISGPKAQPANTPTNTSQPWRIDINLSASVLKHLDAAPHVLSLLEHFQDVKPHKTSLFLLLSELLHNAVDHGLLKLDSALKQDHGGLDHYLALREERMAKVDHGQVSVIVEKVFEDYRPLLKLSVRDSGDGFDFRRYEAESNDDSHSFGRGLKLVKSLCTRVEFHHNGSETVVFYPL